jgi:hypothetical protein
LYCTQVKLPFTLNQEIPSIEKIRFAKNNIVDFGFLLKMPNLKSIDAFQANLLEQDLSIVENLSKLKYFCIGASSINASSPKLRELHAKLQKRGGGVYCSTAWKKSWISLIDSSVNMMNSV